MTVSFYSLLILSMLGSPFYTFAGEQGMPGMPKIQPKKVFSVKTNEEGEELLEDWGFGDKEPEVRMMNLMMVEGSGYEGMDMSNMNMADMKMADAKGSHAGHGTVTAAVPVKKQTKNEVELFKSPASPKVGANIYQFATAPKVKVKAEVYMTNMDMGTETPKVKEIKPGLYQVKANFSMAGPWALKIITPKGERVFDIQVSK